MPPPAQSPSPAGPEIRLRQRILAGESGAAAELLDEHLTPVYQFVHFRVGRDRGLVEDVVQDTFLTALQSLASWDGRSSLRGWLVGIAKNKIRETRRRRAPIPLEDALAEAAADIDAILADVSREPLPDHVLERRETSELVGAALSSLPEDYQRALLDKYVEGRSTADIARSTGRSEKAAESLLTRSRTAFARVFELLARKRGGLT
ncbi:MAG: sigma-70 family RNA polymerase sigma factor [Planctomycetota bacterium]|nr:sigma-70 family RNA polymerase sigma factor [Planctomycetota bacterium]